MKMIIGEDISKTYVEKNLLNHTSFSIQDKERVGLIGVNGTGKSTLLKVIAGIEQPDTGTITSSSDYRISFLPQEPLLTDQHTILEHLYSRETHVNLTIKKYEACLRELETNPMEDALHEKLASLQEQMDRYQAWEASAQAKTMLNKLGIVDVHLKIENLSGGQKKRVALAQTLLEAADLLILDEPTNHLDFEAIEWLEDYLNKYNGSVLLVTHDRYFLDRVTNRIFELHQGEIHTYSGNYGSYLEAKALREEELQKTEAKQKSLFRKELEWMRKGAKARTTKQKARIQRFEELEKKVSNGSSSSELELITGTTRLGKNVIEFKEASLKFGSTTIFEKVTLLIKQKDRIGIVGPNGVGKSTLLNLMAGKEQPDSGEVKVGLTVKVGYYTQQQQEMNPNQRMIEYIKEEAEVLKAEDGTHISASQLLERFLFPPYSHGSPIGKLSGGEKKRLYLLRILMSQPNVLLLDEPTNDLDTETLTVLEAYLEEFPGVVITVSHDRYFLDKVVEELLILEGNGQIERIFGEYSDYMQRELRRKQEEKEAGQVQKSLNSKQSRPKPLKLSYQEQKDWETIEDRIMTLEEEISSIEKEVSNAGSDYEKIRTWLEKQKETTAQLEQLMERWEELSEKVDKINTQTLN